MVYSNFRLQSVANFFSLSNNYLKRPFARCCHTHCGALQVALEMLGPFEVPFAPSGFLQLNFQY